MQNTFERALGKIKAYSRQDATAQEIEKRALPLISNIRTGNNYFTPDQYHDVIRFLLPFDEDEKREKALRSGTYNPGQNVVIQRVKWLNQDKLVDLKTLCKLTKIPYKTLWRRLRNLKVPEKRVGGKKMYDIDTLRTYIEIEKDPEKPSMIEPNRARPALEQASHAVTQSS